MLVGYLYQLIHANNMTDSRSIIFDGSNYEFEEHTKFDKHAFFSTMISNGNSGSSKTIDWTAGNKQSITTTGSCTLTFTAPTGPCNLLLKIIHEASSTSYTYTYPATVYWPSGTKLTTTNTSGAIDIVSFYFDGTNYFAQGAAAFATS
jgi:hypothetical protein